MTVKISKMCKGVLEMENDERENEVAIKRAN